MAGGGQLGGGHKPKRGKASKRKKMKRVGFVLDMTPLVDITFLLLTFFMFTTTMATPQVMEMSVPPESPEDVKINEKELMTILVSKEGNIFWFMGNETAEKISIKDIKALATRKNLEKNEQIDLKNKLITALKVSPESPYGLIINILDELNLAEIEITERISQDKNSDGSPVARKRKFTIGKFTEVEQKKIDEVQVP